MKTIKRALSKKERKELEKIRDSPRILGPLDLTPLFARFILYMDDLIPSIEKLSKTLNELSLKKVGKTKK